MKFIKHILALSLLIGFANVNVIGQTKTPLHNDYLQRTLVEKNGKYGLEEHNGEQVIPCEYTKIEPLNLGANSFYKCYVGKEFILYNEQGKKHFNDLKLTDIRRSDDGYTYLIAKSGIGTVDQDFNVAIPPIYKSLSLGIETYHPWYQTFLAEKDKKYGLYIGDSLVLKPEYDKIEFDVSTDEHFLKINKNNLVGLLEPIHGGYKELLPLEYQSIELSAPMGYAAIKVRKNNLEGIFMDNEEAGTKLSEMLPIAYNKIDWNKYNGITMPAAYKGQKGQLLIHEDAFQGNSFWFPKIKFILKKFNLENEILVYRAANKKFGILHTEDHNEILEAKYDHISEKTSYKSDYIIVGATLNGVKGSLILFENKSVFAKTKEWVFDEEYLVVQNIEGKYGLVNMYLTPYSKQYLLEPIYQKVIPYADRNFIVQQENNWFILNEEARKLTEEVFTSLEAAKQWYER